MDTFQLHQSRSHNNLEPHIRKSSCAEKIKYHPPKFMVLKDNYKIFQVERTEDTKHFHFTSIIFTILLILVINKNLRVMRICFIINYISSKLFKKFH